ncbi:hypothetical protein SH611_10380 [Geminicoccaceae bacterium 1502E]|nr:hypothetical protein [Geminicoccaceae bacterium 1502E]
MPKRQNLAALLGGSTVAASAMIAVSAAPVPPDVATDRPPGIEQLLDPASVARGVCGPQDRKRSTFFKPGFVQLAAATQATGARDADAEPWNFLGDLSWKVTATPDAQAWFDQGLRWSYAFNHMEALRAFRKAQALDPDCAMCSWGEAFALGPNINAPMDEAAVGPAFAAAMRAQELAARSTPGEQAVIAAIVKRYATSPGADRAALDRAYADAMAEAATAFPADHAIATLYADALMNLSPWDYWESDHATPREHIAPAIAAVEKVLAENPDHSFAIHLYIHLVEASTTPGRAAPFADRLAAAMPGAGHIVHMPGHIYFRIGRYLDALESNHAAVAADEFLFEQIDDPGLYAWSYYPHNVHFLLESARLAGDAETALEAAEKLPGVMSDEVARVLPWVEIIKAAPYFAHAQFSPPATTLALPEPGSGFPYVTAMWHYARGVAQAMAGDAAAAREEIASIEAIAKETDWSHMTDGGVPAPELLELARHLVTGRIAQAQGRFEDAVAAFDEAAALQDSLPYLEPPYWYYPVHQSLGAALLQAGHPIEAEAVFERGLLDFPNNAWSLWGLVQARKARGDEAGAAATEALFRKAWGGDARAMPELARL